MSEYEEYMKIACWVCCPVCDEKKCVGRFECEEIKEYMEKMKNDQRTTKHFA